MNNVFDTALKKKKHFLRGKQSLKNHILSHRRGFHYVASFRFPSLYFFLTAWFSHSGKFENNGLNIFQYQDYGLK